MNNLVTDYCIKKRKTKQYKWNQFYDLLIYTISEFKKHNVSPMVLLHETYLPKFAMEIVPFRFIGDSIVYIDSGEAFDYILELPASNPEHHILLFTKYALRAEMISDFIDAQVESNSSFDSIAYIDSSTFQMNRKWAHSTSCFLFSNSIFCKGKLKLEMKRKEKWEETEWLELDSKFMDEVMNLSHYETSHCTEAELQPLHQFIEMIGKLCTRFQKQARIDRQPEEQYFHF